MPDLNRPSRFPLAPETPPVERRWLGLLGLAAVIGLIAAGVWLLKSRVAPVDNTAPPVFHQRP